MSIVCRHGRPARGTESGRIEDGIIDVDEPVADAIFDCG